MTTTSFLFALGGPEVILIILVILIFFGAKRIPDLMKSMGKGVRSFKEGMKEIQDEIEQPADNSDKEIQN